MCVCLCVRACMQVYGHPPLTGPDVFLPGSQTTIWLGSAQSFNPTPTPDLLGGPPAVPRSDPRPGAPVLWEPEPGPFLVGGPSRILDKIVKDIVGLRPQGYAHDWARTKGRISKRKWLKIEFRIKRMWRRREKNSSDIVDLITESPSVSESHQTWR